MRCAVLALVAAAPLPGQGSPKPPKWKIDPYTKNKPELMQKLGYVSYGPFVFGQQGRDAVQTDKIEAQIPYAELIWVETAHFRIGQHLPPYVVPSEIDTRKKIRGEIERLHAVLPTFNPRTRVLDPWLRLHLTALRLEDTYREMQQLLGVSDQDFPASPDQVVRGRGRYMGMGPYLGMTDKYLIFVTEKEGMYLDYLARFIGKRTPFGQVWHFKEVGSMFYGVATDLNDGRLRHDTALHGDLVFNTVHTLVQGFRHFSYHVPVWINEGLAHWFQRRVDPRWNSFTQNEGGLADLRPLWRWEPETRQLILAGKGAPFSEMYTWRDYTQICFIDHILMWSRWDYLMTLGPDKFATFMFEIKGRVDPETWIADETELVAATREALRKAYGLTPLSLDERWKQWVLETYPPH